MFGERSVGREAGRRGTPGRVKYILFTTISEGVWFYCRRRDSRRHAIAASRSDCSNERVTQISLFCDFPSLSPDDGNSMYHYSETKWKATCPNPL
ncbi:hypothetical protein EVAR_31271_1 [Eumeta japonica]|uniref:Uncharacterized protein n=1 Tax=Eumeta variegata TaxID=151549 RepID=A0A4C1VPT3_EUMVA|nr:hypothetical protein EVAR_31271_1 [Eumeta japonica]